MIIDSLAEADRYAALHPSLARAFEYLRATDFAALPPGRYEIDEAGTYVSIDHAQGRGEDGARLEYHREYIDLQLTLEGRERIGWLPLAMCRAVAAPFDPAKDVGFFADRPETWLDVRPGFFAIFFPEDAHAPLAGTGPVKKAIVKIRL